MCHGDKQRRPVGWAVRAVLAAGGAFVITRPWAVAIAVVAVAVTLGIVSLVGRVAQRAALRERQAVDAGAKRSAAQQRRRGLGGLYIGTDGRASTSKVQPLLWTVAVFFAVAFLIAWGRASGCDTKAHKQGARCKEAAVGRAAFDDFKNHGIQQGYFVLLGIPLAVAVAAKATTAAKVEDKTLDKPALTVFPSGLAPLRTLGEIVSNDNGELDLLDAQYFAFNLLLLAVFFIQFLTRPGDGLPDLPPTLLALSGVGASAYTTKKVLEGRAEPLADQPATAPQAATQGQAVEVSPAPEAADAQAAPVQ